jgi:Domain of unknown function (DUF3885)
MQFPEYMRGRFPELQLGPDLFHQWTVGIRFELNANHWPNVQWDAVLDRAMTIYEAVFQQGDIGFIVSGHEFEFEDKGRGPGKIPEFRNSVFALSRKKSLGLHGIAGRQRVMTYHDSNTKIITTYRWTEMEPRSIGYHCILRSIMHNDFPSKQPRIGDRVYFINRSRNIILHMYDDRGLDLIAPQVDDLRPVYEAHKTWVLDHDRSSIDNLFANAE